MDAKSGETKQEHSSPANASEQLSDLIASVLQLSSATAMLAHAMMQQTENTQDLIAMIDPDNEGERPALGTARGGRVS